MPVFRVFALAALVAVVAVSCSSPPSSLGDAGPLDASADDAGPPDAALTVLGPSLGFDSIALTGANMVFKLIGDQLLNDQLSGQIESGQFLLVIELRRLDDPSGQSDDSIDLGFYNGLDDDGDTADNFDAENPETLLASPASVGAEGEPLILFADATIDGGVMVAEGVLDLPFLGGISLPLGDAVVEGTLVSSPDETVIYYLDDATLSGSVPVSVLGLVPNPMTGTCPGANLLDVVVTSCGMPVSQQPDVDLDDDGLETFHDSDGSGDGVIDRCVDGNGTEYLGEGCWNDPNFADGYLLVFGLHATRVLLAIEQ